MVESGPTLPASTPNVCSTSSGVSSVDLIALYTECGGEIAIVHTILAAQGNQNHATCLQPECDSFQEALFGKR